MNGTDRPKLADTTPAMASRRSLDEAISEVEREINIRLKCFDRWVAEGRLGYVDAKDRLERLIKAFLILSTSYAKNGEVPQIEETKVVDLPQAVNA